ncbi:MAG: trypsin-like peptidase domain-containing protein [Bacilli bacterium]|jgi:S1-C subfamily serine protease
MKKYLILIVLLLSLTGCEFLEETFSNNTVPMASINAISQNVIKSNIEITVKPYTLNYLSQKVYSDHFISGSGVVYAIKNEDIYLLTNRHVVIPNGGSNYDYLIQTVNGTEVEARYIYSSDIYDLAILAFTKTDTLAEEVAKIRFASENEILGGVVYAVGSPFGMNNILTVGKVYKYSNIDEVDFQIVLHTAPINTGNSGGMLINKDYYLVGINTWNVTVNGTSYSGATPILEVLEFLESAPK